MTRLLKTSCALLLALFSQAWAQTTSSSTPLPQSQITLTLSSKQLQAKVGEDVLISLVITNVPDLLYCERHMLETGEPELNGYKLKVWNSNGEALTQTPQPLPRGMRSVTRLCLEPGETRREMIDISKLFRMNTSGVYRLSVEHLDKKANVTVLSNDLNLAIVQ
jgi:hypothetical protein